MTETIESVGDAATRRVGVVGLGAIGAGVAANVADAGFSLSVLDVSPDAVASFADRAQIAGSAGEIGAAVDCLIVAVINDEQVRAVLSGPDGALEAMAPGSTVVIVSTISPSTVAAVAEEAAAHGISVVDCGVSGGPSAATAGELISMVGGDDEAIEGIGDVLAAFSSLVITMGPLGTGLVAKLARNVVQYGSWLAAYEGQRIAEAAGIELAKLAEVIRASDAKIGGASTLMFRPTVAPLGDDDHPGLVSAMQAGASLAHKDLRAALALGGDLDLDLPLVELTEEHCDSIFGIGEESA